MNWFQKIYNRFAKMPREFLIAIFVAFMFASSAPWWIKYIPWNRLPFRLTWDRAETAKILFLPGDFEIDVNVPYNRPNVTPVEVKVEAKSGTATLLRKGELTEQDIDNYPFPGEVQWLKNVSLLRVYPKDPLVGGSQRTSSVLLEFDSSSLIPSAYFVSYFRKGSKYKFGNLKVKLFYEAEGKLLFEEVIIPMYFVMK